MILLGVAITAVTGCVAVEPRPVPVPRPATSSGSRVPRDVEPQVVQAPVSEALEAVGPTGGPKKPAPRSSPEARRTAPGRVRGSEPPPPPATDRPRQRPRERPKEQRTPALSPAPAVSGVCGLGEDFGGWPKDSPEARICRDVYGN
jgi:hypothetical protein